MQITEWKKVKTYSFDDSVLQDMFFIMSLSDPVRVNFDHLVEFNAVIDGDKRVVKVYARNLFIKDNEDA